jgi:hypothetical protein
MIMREVAKREFPILSGQSYDRSVALLLRVLDDTFALFVQCTSAFWVSRLHVIRLLYSGLGASGVWYSRFWRIVVQSS